MDIIFKTVGIAMVTLILCQFLGKQNKDIATLVGLAACCIVITGAGYYLESIVSFIRNLRITGNLNEEFIEILLKAVGIGLVCELASLICADAGNTALGKSIHIMASGAILWISLPLFTSLIDLINTILGEP